MTSTAPSNKLKHTGPNVDAFNRFFASLHGHDRWHATLLPSLLAPPKHAALINPFCEPLVLRQALAQASGTLSRVAWLKGVTAITSDQAPISNRDAGDGDDNDEGDLTDGDKEYDDGDQRHVAKHAPFVHPLRDVHNLATYYLMDLASMMPVEALNVSPGHDVLDMCAAPGGKTLNIAYRLFPTTPTGGKHKGSLTANEPSTDRRLRLRDVLTSHLPVSIVTDHVQLTSLDGAAFTRGYKRFHRILIDAPCSSERHVLRDPSGEITKWTSSRTKTAARRQEKLLWSGLSVVLPGGTLVYATCSLSQAENDGVVKRVLARVAKKKKRAKAKARAAAVQESDDDESQDEDDEYDEEDDAWYNLVKVSMVRREWPIGEPTKYGWIVLPDQGQGWGPLYFAVFKCTGVE
ncbi:S-adenosyl-L-methionine-dependent methyltransferase [Catenaria anguillulae PL171]|uniref:NOL1/NOP2/Sun domain family member 4 n=1 Tax=Catenaria anguillulae PL171 TaxID=765915 RepID=A0A1Y2HHK4_9FUNG|nr:S-adenosyl-L-methionine-dependent methyltransferase [Catenaria anguillulae PL171]